MTPVDEDIDGLGPLDSGGLAAYIIDALLRANIVREADVERAMKIATEEIEVRNIMSGYTK